MALDTAGPPAGSSQGAPAEGRTRKFRRPRLARGGHLRWWHEVLLVAVGYAIYTLIRNHVPSHDTAAVTNAHRVVRLEKTLGIFHEHGVNTWLYHHHAIGVVANYWYAVMHFLVTIIVAVWVLWKHPRHARPLRIAWYSTNLFALIGFAFFPLVPPRLLPHGGFYDTVVLFGTWGSWGKHGIDAASNQYAAMPSMHIGWSTWCAIVIAVLAKRWWVKAIGIAYPIVTFFVIIGTANHYIMDAIGGLVSLALGFGVQRLITRAGPFAPEPLPPPRIKASARPHAADADPAHPA